LIVGTPGRLIDHIQNTKGFTLDDVETLVLDEADRLLEMGFKDELMNIVN
jgi:superfamily II DNA/RNA helicase